MNEINIGSNIIKLRKENAITQDVLATFLGVSKAAISKWETRQSYPDITLLPKIATYFNVSVDTLIGYQPQMNNEEIRLLYESFTKRFTTQSYNEVIDAIYKVIHEYYSCYPLILQMGALLLNYANMADEQMKETVLNQAYNQFIRIRNESNTFHLIEQARNLEASCLLMMNKPNEAIALFEGSSTILVSNEVLCASAYQMLGNNKQAELVIQVGSYQYMLVLIEQLITYLTLCTNQHKRFEEVYKRAITFANTFHLASLHPAILMKLYIVGAQGYMQIDKEQTLSILEAYCELVNSDIYPLSLHSDDFFTLIDLWIQKINYPFPRDQISIYKDITQIVIDNPVFAPLQNNQRFKQIIRTLNKDERS